MKNMLRYTLGYILGSFGLLFGPPTYRASALSGSTQMSHFNKVMIVIFENSDYSDAIIQPFFSEFAKKGATMSQFFAETHPSQPNYIALTSGDTHGVRSDSSVDLKVKSIADLLEAQGKTWKVYAEAYPGKCFLGSRSGTYVRKHVPLLSYTNIQNDPTRCERITDSTSLQLDIQNGTLPDYSLYIPDLNNDGHDTGPAYASKWFSGAFGPLLQNSQFMNGMLLVATFDEGDLIGTNQVYTVLYGAGILPGSESTTHYDHYSLLRTIEDQLSLGTLGAHDQSSSSITGIWK